MKINRLFPQSRQFFTVFAIIGFFGVSTFVFTNAEKPSLSKIVYSRGGLIYIIDEDGKNEKQITKSPEDLLSIANDRQPSCSSDGKRIAFRATRTAIRWDIWVVDVDGKNLKNLTDDPAADQHPAWSPDGKKIAFDRGGLDGIWVVDIDGKNLKRLTSGPGAEPSWSPDGNKIAFHRLNPPEAASIYGNRYR